MRADGLTAKGASTLALAAFMSLRERGEKEKPGLDHIRTGTRLLHCTDSPPKYNLIPKST